ncbi:MAG: hypothetical protein JRH20_09790, partial [Deltaproteobacteria bacterium]|nr:hypothetical protein [Deltaproteobacteria bacterium]
MVLENMRASVKEFNRHWAAYESKKTLVNAALVKAKAAPKEAEATLRAVLTAPPRD